MKNPLLSLLGFILLVPWQSLTLTNGAFYFNDPEWTNLSRSQLPPPLAVGKRL